MAKTEVKERTREDSAFMNAQPQAEHAWLEKFKGRWKIRGQSERPDGKSETMSGTENVRSIGSLWVVAEGRGEGPDAGDHESQFTLGYDTRTAKFVGSWVGSMMTHHWVYEGDLDDDAERLTLYAEGPDMSGGAGVVMYRDVHSFDDAEHRTLRSAVQNEEGEWREFMLVTYTKEAS
jgi:hypothetical protein